MRIEVNVAAEVTRLKFLRPGVLWKKRRTTDQPSAQAATKNDLTADYADGADWFCSFIRGIREIRG